MSRESPPFRTALRRASRPGDLALLLAVPVVLVAAYLLPAATKRALAFDYTRPTAVGAVTAHYVHFEVAHLAANLLSYTILVALCYPLAVLAGRGRLFRVAVVVYLFAFPPVLSALNLAVSRPAVGYGFSGVTMAFAGLLPLLLVEYVRVRLLPTVTIRHAPGLFLFVLAVTPLLVLPKTPVSLGLSAAAGLGAVGYGATAARAYTRVYGWDAGPLGQLLCVSGWSDLFVLATVLVVLYPFVGYPADLVADGAVVNVYVHLLGFCLAFLAPYVTTELDVFDDATRVRPVTTRPRDDKF